MPPVELWRVEMFKIVYPNGWKCGESPTRIFLGEATITARWIEDAEEHGRRDYPEATACRGYCKDSAGLWHWVFCSSF